MLIILKKGMRTKIYKYLTKLKQSRKIPLRVNELETLHIVHIIYI
jgi:hypothetical protein